MATLKDDLVRCLTGVKGAAKLPQARIAAPRTRADADAAHAPRAPLAPLDPGRRPRRRWSSFTGIWWFGRAGSDDVVQRRNDMLEATPAFPPARPRGTEPATAAPRHAAAAPATAAGTPIVEAMPRQPVVVPAASASARRPTRPVSFLPNPAPSAPVAAGAPPRRGAAASPAEATAGDPTVALIPATLPAPSAPASPASCWNRRRRRSIAEPPPRRCVARARRSRPAVRPLAAHLLLGDVYYHMERYAEALREYQAALKLDPDNPIANRGRQLALRQVEPATE